MIKLDRKERLFLALLNEPGATISIGTSAGKRLLARRLVRVAKFGRYGITPAGAEAIAAYASKPKRNPAQKALELL